MTNKKIAVFTTSDIQQLGRNSEIDKPISFAKNGTPLYSTGRLEKAISEEYEIFVMTTRDIFGDHDQWWIRLVGKLGNIYHSFYTGRGLYDKGAIEAWRKLYDQLGLNPDCLKETWDSKLNSEPGWDYYRIKLPSFGIKLGRDFE